MHILQLTAENIKKLTAVEITPDGNLVQITGKNGQGKTSVLDAIWWALAGKDAIQKAPIRHGAQEARISLDLGEIKITRKFKARDDKSITTSIVVENAEGARFQSPQKMLDGLLGSICFDPLEFTRMTPRDQFDQLKAFVSNFDFDAAESASKADYAARTEINRRAKDARTLASQIQVAADLPADPIDENALVDELQNIGTTNAAIEATRSKREGAARTIASWEQEAARYRQEAESLKKQADEADAKAADLRKKLEEAKPLPELADASNVRAKIDKARRVNEGIAQRESRAGYTAQVTGLEAQAAALTKAMEQREHEKRQAVTQAKLPVESLTLGDGQILMDGLPFNQASDADQLRVSMAIAMASNPALRVLRVRDGSLLDEDSLALIAEMAVERDYQVWIERVDSSGTVGIVLEDGHVKGASRSSAIKENTQEEALI